MQEIELKFLIPEAALAAVQAQALAAGAGATRLQAFYFDTPDRHLARARAALRLRHEGVGGWVQTLKAQGVTVMQRLEHNLPRGDGPVRPALDLAAHLSEPALAQALAVALEWSSGPALAEAVMRNAAAAGLQERFGTDIRRQHWRMACGPAGRSEVEFALDVGEVLAGEARQAVCELEIELCRGEPADLLMLAGEAVARHGLWLDVRSKAERGERLRSGEPLPPVPAILLQRSPRPAGTEAWQTPIGRLLDGLLTVGSVLACPSLGHLPQRPHAQAWHRGLGALHQALSEAEAAGAVGLDPAWSQSLALLLPPLDTADAGSAGIWQRAARSGRWQALCLGLLGWLATSG